MRTAHGFSTNKPAQITVYLILKPLHLARALSRINSTAQSAFIVAALDTNDLYHEFSGRLDLIRALPNVVGAIAIRRGSLGEYLGRGFMTARRVLRSIPRTFSLVAFTLYPHNDVTRIYKALSKRAENVILVEESAHAYGDPLGLRARHQLLDTTWKLFRDKCLGGRKAMVAPANVIASFATYPDLWPEEFRDSLSTLDCASGMMVSDIGASNTRDIFGYSTSVDLESRDVIVLSQPLSQDKLIIEEQAIRLYSEIVKTVGADRIIFKKHPRDSLTYPFESEVVTVNHLVPVEAIPIRNRPYRAAISVYSSSVDSINAAERVQLAPDFFEKRDLKALDSAAKRFAHALIEAPK